MHPKKKHRSPYLPTTWPRGSCFLTQFQYSLVAQVENRGRERAPLAFPGSLSSPGDLNSGMNWGQAPKNGKKWDPYHSHKHLGRWTVGTSGTYSHHPWKERKMIRTIHLQGIMFQPFIFTRGGFVGVPEISRESGPKTRVIKNTWTEFRKNGNSMTQKRKNIASIACSTIRSLIPTIPSNL